MLYMHIGMPRTGTSSIQRYFRDNAEPLSEEGIAYPLHFGQQHHALGLEIGRARHERTALTREFLQYLGDQRDKTVVVSSETLTNALGKQKFPNFVDFIQQCELLTKVRIILFIRRFDSFFQSMYLQSVFTGKIGSEFSDYLDKRRNWIEQFLTGKAALKPIVGPENMLVVGYRQEVDSIEVIRKVMGIRLGFRQPAWVGPVPGGAARGAKAISFLKNYDLFAARFALRRPLKWWRREIWAGRVTFKNDLLADYSLYIDARDAEIHLHGLNLSRTLGERDYWNLFKDDRLKSGCRVTLRPDLLDKEDALALQSYEKLAKPDVGGESRAIPG